MSSDPGGAHAGVDVRWLGHASVDVRLGSTRLLTDPVLRRRVAHLRRHAAPATLLPGAVDAVLLSHLHHDHLDLASLRRLPMGTPIVVPRGAARLVAGVTGGEVIEMGPEDEVTIGDVRVTAVPADHRSGRTLSRLHGAPLGFLMERDGRCAYFAGDTDLNPAMADLPAVDIALLPIWGWGRTLGPGHLDPDRAAQAASLVRAGTVVPVHWGTFAPVRLGRGAPAWLGRPIEEFRAAMARHAPEATIEVLPPG